MDKIDKDLKLALNVQPYNDDIKIFKSSNEPLNFIFNNFDLRDKKVLSVLASADQIFYFLYNGTKKIETFDINGLTEYYFYLRKWCLQKRKKFYPFFLSKEELLKVVETVVVNSKKEQQAKDFWNRYFSINKEMMNSNLFYENYCNPLIVNYFDITKLLQELAKYELVFKKFNIFNNVEKENNFDIVYMSNILQTAAFEEDKLKGCRENLKKLLNSTGIVICSNLFASKEEFLDVNEVERNIFEKDFKYEPIYSYDPLKSDYTTSAYTYTKK